MFKDAIDAFNNLNNKDLRIKRKANALLKKKIARELRLDQKKQSLTTVPNCGLQQPRQRVINRNLKYIEKVK